MRAIEALVNNAKWGDPKQYDIIIEKVKTGAKDRDVEYNVIPELPTLLDAGIAELAKYVPVNLNALIKGKIRLLFRMRKSAKEQNEWSLNSLATCASPFVALYEAS